MFISILPFFSFTSFKPCNFLSLFPYRPSLFNLPFFFLSSFSFSLACYFFYFSFIFLLSAFHTLCSPFILSTQLVLLSFFPHSLFSFHPFHTACSPFILSTQLVLLSMHTLLSIKIFSLFAFFIDPYSLILFIYSCIPYVFIVIKSLHLLYLDCLFVLNLIDQC